MFRLGLHGFQIVFARGVQASLFVEGPGWWGGVRKDLRIWVLGDCALHDAEV